MAELHAQSYAVDGPGFYFDNEVEYDRQIEQLAKRGYEEFEIQFIDGDSEDAELFSALKISQGEVGRWFDDVEPLDTQEKATLFYLADHGYGLDESLRLLRDGDRTASQGSMVDYVYEYLDDIGGAAELGEETLQTYFDYEAFGRDISLSGDATSGLQDDAEYAREHGDEEEAERLEAEIERIDGLSNRELGEETVESLGWDGVGDQNLTQYFDHEKFARDLVLGGDRLEFEFAGETWTAPNY